MKRYIVTIGFFLFGLGLSFVAITMTSASSNDSVDSLKVQLIEANRVIVSLQNELITREVENKRNIEELQDALKRCGDTLTECTDTIQIANRVIREKCK